MLAYVVTSAEIFSGLSVTWTNADGVVGKIFNLTKSAATNVMRSLLVAMKSLSKSVCDICNSFDTCMIADSNDNPDFILIYTRVENGVTTLSPAGAARVK